MVFGTHLHSYKPAVGQGLQWFGSEVFFKNPCVRSWVVSLRWYWEWQELGKAGPRREIIKLPLSGHWTLVPHFPLFTSQEMRNLLHHIPTMTYYAAMGSKQ